MAVSKEEARKELARRELGRRQSTSATSGYQRPPDFSRRLGAIEPQSPGATGGVPFTAEMKAAFVDDPQTKAKIYAESLFPGYPGAIERFGVMDGDIVYRDPQYNLVSADREGLLGNLREFVAEQPAYLPHEVLGTIGAVSGGPLLAALGVAGGEGYRKAAGSLLFDEPQTTGGNIADMGTMGILGGYLPTKAGQWLGKFMQRGVTRDIDKLDPEEFLRLDRLSREKSVPLTVAEKTDLPSLKAYQTALNNITDSADDMARFYSGRADDVERAVTKELGNISKVDSAEDAAALAVNATKSARNRIAKKMREEAAPLYKQAYESGPVDVNDVVKGIDETIVRYPEKGKIARSLSKVKQLLTRPDVDEQGNKIRVALDDLESLDYAKREIDDIIGTAQRQGQKSLVREMTDHKNALLSRMDDISPEYKMARDIWTEGMDALDKVDSTAVKVIANLPEERYITAAKRMFNPKTTGPKAIGKARRVIQKEDPNAWNALTRAYIEDAWEDASRVSDFSRGQTFKRMIFGDVKKKNALKTMLDKEQFQSMSDLMDILDATGRVKQVGSDTAYKQEIIKELNEKWGSGWDDVTRPIGWIRENLGRARIGKNAKQMAKILTDQDAPETIKLIKQLPPGSQQRINAVSFLLGFSATPSDVIPPEDVTPPIDQSAPRQAR